MKLFQKIAALSTGIALTSVLYAQSLQETQTQQKQVAIEFSFSALDSYDNCIFELGEGVTNRISFIANKSQETKLPTAGIGWKSRLLPEQTLSLKGIEPIVNGAYYGTMNDWFAGFPMSYSQIEDENGNSARVTKRLRDENGNFLPRQGPKSGKNAFAYYEAVPRTTNLMAVTIDYAWITPQDGRLDFESYRVTPLQVAIMPKQRPLQSLLLHNFLTDGTPNPYATGCVDEKGSPRAMVLQRSFGDIVGPWQNVYTNSITAENPYGSINFVDDAAKSAAVAFYRVVSPETAKQSGISPANLIPSSLESKTGQ